MAKRRPGAREIINGLPQSLGEEAEQLPSLLKKRLQKTHAAHEAKRRAVQRAYHRFLAASADGWDALARKDFDQLSKAIAKENSAIGAFARAAKPARLASPRKLRFKI